MFEDGLSSCGWQIVANYPALTPEAVRTAIVYAGELSHERIRVRSQPPPLSDVSRLTNDDRRPMPPQTKEFPLVLSKHKPS